MASTFLASPLLCPVALSRASVAPTSSSKRRLDQLPSRCSIALVALGWKCRNCLHQRLLRSNIYWSIVCLYEQDLVLLQFVFCNSYMQKLITLHCMSCLRLKQAIWSTQNMPIPWYSHQKEKELWIYDGVVRGCYHVRRKSLEVKLPTIWTDEKQRWEESEKREE